MLVDCVCGLPLVVASPATLGDFLSTPGLVRDVCLLVDGVGIFDSDLGMKECAGVGSGALSNIST